MSTSQVKRDLKDHKEKREMTVLMETPERREKLEIGDQLVTKEPKDLRDLKDLMDLKDQGERKVIQELREIKDPLAQWDLGDPRDTKEKLEIME